MKAERKRRNLTGLCPVCNKRVTIKPDAYDAAVAEGATTAFEVASHHDAPCKAVFLADLANTRAFIRRWEAEHGKPIAAALWGDDE